MQKTHSCRAYPRFNASFFWKPRQLTSLSGLTGPCPISGTPSACCGCLVRASSKPPFEAAWRQSVLETHSHLDTTCAACMHRHNLGHGLSGALGQKASLTLGGGGCSCLEIYSPKPATGQLLGFSSDPQTKPMILNQPHRELR